MPFLSETMEEGTVGVWLKQLGDRSPSARASSRSRATRPASSTSQMSQARWLRSSSQRVRPLRRATSSRGSRPAPEVSRPTGPADGTEPATGPVPGYSSLKGEPEYLDLTRAQRAVVRQMVKSKTTAPHFYVFADANMTLALSCGRSSSRRVMRASFHL